MRALAAFLPEFATRFAPVCHTMHATELHGTPVAFAIIERPAVQLSTQDKAHAAAVLVRVQAFSCNYRERARVLGAVQQRARPGYVVVGSEFAGTVVDVRPEVSSLRIGDRVCGNGSVETLQSHPGLSTQRASAEFQVHMPDKLFRLPDTMSMAQGAAFSVGAQTAYAMVRRLNAAPGSHVAVTAAASNTSLFVIRALAQRGCFVHAITTSPGLDGHLRQSGAQHVITIPRNEQYVAALRGSLTNVGLPAFDAVVDPFSDVYLRKLLPFVKRFGTYVTCGVLAQFNPADDDPFIHLGLGIDEVFSLLIRKSLVFVGNNLGTTADLSAAADDFSAGLLKVKLDTVVRDGALQQFVERSFLTQGHCGKVVYEFQQPMAAVAPQRGLEAGAHA